MQLSMAIDHFFIVFCFSSFLLYQIGLLCCCSTLKSITLTITHFIMYLPTTKERKGTVHMNSSFMRCYWYPFLIIDTIICWRNLAGGATSMVLDVVSGAGGVRMVDVLG